MRNLTRSKLIQMWFAAVVVMIAACLAFGVNINVGTGGILMALSLVPPVIVMMLWPGEQPLTAAEVLRGTDRREAFRP
jgi:hypothetical protein